MVTELIMNAILGLIIVLMVTALVVLIAALSRQSLERAYRCSRRWLGNKIGGQYNERPRIPQRSKYTGPEDISNLRISLIEKAEKIQIPHYFQVFYSHILIAAALKGRDVSSYHVMIEKSNELIEVPLYAYRSVREALAKFC